MRFRPRALRRAGLNTLGVLVALVTLFPILWMVSTAFKPASEIYSLTPHPLPAHPTLGNFFKIWGVPLSRNQVWTYRPGPGETMKVWVNKRPYAGNPAGIVLGSHKLITIEIGPPFKTPSSFTWGSL